MENVHYYLYWIKSIMFNFLRSLLNAIYKRHLNLQNKRLHFRKSDKLTFSMIKALSARAMNHLTVVKPDTLLVWQRKFIKNFWSYKHNTPGRKPISRDLKNLILEMKMR